MPITRGAAHHKTNTKSVPVGKGAPSGEGSGDLVDLGVLSSASGMAAALATAADALTTAVETGQFCSSLDHNMQLWQAIKAVVSGTGGGPAQVRDGLARQADIVAASTLALGASFTVDGVLSLIGIDIDVATGLMQGIKEKMTRDRSYYLWLESGGKVGGDLQHWMVAESEIKGMTDCR